MNENINNEINSVKEAVNFLQEAVYGITCINDKLAALNKYIESELNRLEKKPRRN